jgi:23S rRNA-/tRNA-specific pseudouridylate synthase
VQGGTGVDLSLDQLLPAAFPEYWEDIPTGKKALAAFKSGGGDQRLKLTHRLDRQVTGVLLLGVGIDGAARLGTAFSGKSLAASGGGGPRQAAAGAAVPQVHKVYWAVVCRENEEDDKIEGFRLKKGESGSIEAALGGGGGTPALTRLRVLETSADGALAWLELEPVTGRKHQLRQHAATELGAPILGDGRYGLLRKGHQRLILKDLADNLGQKKSDETPLLLHCRRMEVRVPGRPPAAASAPLPPAWTALLHAQGWPLPDDS